MFDKISKKGSFLGRLNSIINQGGSDDMRELPVVDAGGNDKSVPDETWAEGEGLEGQLMVDMYQTPQEIVIETMVAGIRPEDLNVSIGRDMVTIRGSRDRERSVTDEDYFYKELFWGTFSRTIVLPHEVDVDLAEAMEKNGLLSLRLPKIDKDKQMKLRVKTK